MDQSFFEIRGAESVISLENLAQETRLSNNIQSTVFFYYHTPMRQLDVKEYFRVLLTSALDRLVELNLSRTTMPTEQQTTLLMKNESIEI